MLLAKLCTNNVVYCKNSPAFTWAASSPGISQACSPRLHTHCLITTHFSRTQAPSSNTKYGRDARCDVNS